MARADQRERLELYLRGLLDGAEPKSAEAMARRLARGPEAGKIAQSLQHFVGSSPWDVDRFLTCFRSLLDETRKEQPRIGVIQEVVFPKKGQFSVGTQRQLARPLSRKINCQVAITISELSPDGFFPLTIRLYLPGYWLQEQRGLAERLVPDKYREHLPKSALALRMLDELCAEGRDFDFLTAEKSFLSSPDLRDGLAQRRLTVVRPSVEDAPLAEGIDPPSDAIVPDTWSLWDQGGAAALDTNTELASALAGWCLDEAQRRWSWLKQRLGLDQLQGRGWLGWHHHTALVLAAYGFLVCEPLGAGFPPFPLMVRAWDVT